MSHDTDWIGWTTAAVAVLGVAYAAVKRFFSFVTRADMEATIKGFHDENTDRLDRLSDAAARTEGRIDDLFELISRQR